MIIFLKRVYLLSFCSLLLSDLVTGGSEFLFYLFGLLRFISGFVLFSLNPKQNVLYIIILFCHSLFVSVTTTLFHDFFMWAAFFFIFCVYFFQIPKKNIIIYMSIGLALFIFLQNFKTLYRNEIWFEGSGQSVDKVINITAMASGKFSEEGNINGTINRINQAWIFASIVDRMNRVGDFQGFELLKKYLEAALLPRFLAPSKLQSGGGSVREIFNQFSGHETNSGTSMGLGVFADGYIAAGFSGLLFFSFGLGLLLSFTFAIVERWSRINIFYIVFIFPLLNYAVRPDCELQTTLNHLVKGLIFYGVMVTLTKYRFVLTNRMN